MAVAEPAAPPTFPNPDLVALLRELEERGYHFITPTPATHARVVSRAGRGHAANLRDVFGWNLPFEPGLLDPVIHDLLESAGALRREDGLFRAKLRVASLGERLLLHSAYPTAERDAVFFGPDSYRFAALIEAEMENWRRPEGRASIVDIGGGTGAGALAAAALSPGAEVTMTEINPAALRYARANAAAAGTAVRMIEAKDLSAIEGPIDLALANPPYLADDEGRVYRDGGDGLGATVSLGMARMAAERLAPGGRLILYTGSAIVRGEDRMRQGLAGLAGAHGLSLRYRELDPDVFGEELERPAYAEAERIALVAAIFDRPA